jgi:DNA repair protein RadC
VEISRGLLDASLVHPREVFREAVRAACAAVVLAHNHPSGDPTPSAEDVRITRQLVEAGRVLDIRVLDHVILGLPAPAPAAISAACRKPAL